MRVRAVVGEGRHGSVRREPGVDRGFDVDILGCDLDPLAATAGVLGIGASTGREHHRQGARKVRVPDHAHVPLLARRWRGPGRRRQSC